MENRRVLIIAANVKLTQSAKEDLAPLSLQFETATDKRTALHALAEGTNDAVLGDLDQLTLECLRAARDAGKKTVFILLTDSISSPLNSMAQRFGGVELIEKPYDANYLREAVDVASSLGWGLRNLGSALTDLCERAHYPRGKSREIVRLQTRVLETLSDTSFPLKRSVNSKR